MINNIDNKLCLLKQCVHILEQQPENSVVIWLLHQNKKQDKFNFTKNDRYTYRIYLVVAPKCRQFFPTYEKVNFQKKWTYLDVDLSPSNIITILLAPLFHSVSKN